MAKIVKSTEIRKLLRAGKKHRLKKNLANVLLHKKCL